MSCHDVGSCCVAVARPAAQCMAQSEVTHASWGLRGYQRPRCSFEAFTIHPSAPSTAQSPQRSHRQHDGNLPGSPAPPRAALRCAPGAHAHGCRLAGALLQARHLLPAPLLAAARRPASASPRLTKNLHGPGGFVWGDETPARRASVVAAAPPPRRQPAAPTARQQPASQSLGARVG